MLTTVLDDDSSEYIEHAGQCRQTVCLRTAAVCEGWHVYVMQWDQASVHGQSRASSALRCYCEHTTCASIRKPSSLCMHLASVFAQAPMQTKSTTHAAVGKLSLDAAAARLSPVKSNDDSVMSQGSNASSTRRRRKSSVRRSFSKAMGGGEGKGVIWVNGRPLTLPVASSQNFASPPQDLTNLTTPTQGFTGTTDAINFSLPKHVQEAMGSGNSPSTDDLQALAANAPTPHKFTQITANPLLDQLNPLPRSGQGPAWHAHAGASTKSDESEDSIGPQPKHASLEEDATETVSGGLGAKLKAQLAALRAESAPQQEVEMTSVSQTQPPEHTQQQLELEHQKPYGGKLVSPPDSVPDDDDDANSDPGASASEMTWSAGMGQDLGRQLQARLAKSRKPPSTAKPPVHRAKPTSEQTWSAGMGAGMGAQLRQQLAELRAEGKKGARCSSDAEATAVPPMPLAGPRDADKFPAQPTRVPWTASVPESSEQTWTDSLGRRMRQQLTNIRGLGSESSVPLPQAQQRPSIFDLFADQPVQDKPTWSAGIGEKMRKQLEEMRKRDIEDSAHTASTSSQDQEPVKSPRRFNTTSLPANLPASEQTWTAGMGSAAKRELLQRRSVMKRNNSSPDIEQEGADVLPSPSRSNCKSQTAEEKDERNLGGREYIHQDSLDFHHLEEIPHVIYLLSVCAMSLLFPVSICFARLQSCRDSLEHTL